MRRFSYLIAILTIAVLAQNFSARAAENLIQVDRRAQVSRADLNYDTPATRSEEGMPVGNGRTGSLVWTTPTALRLQINRVDVHAMDSTTVSFPRADSDYGSVCGYLDINLVQAGDDVFTGSAFHQRLSVYDALMTAQGKGVTARALAWPNGDVLAIEIDDQRAQPEPINIDLRMLRYQIQYTNGLTYPLVQEHAVLYRTANHTAKSILGVQDGRITLTQQFRELAFYDSSAVAVAVVGRPSRARYLNQFTVQLSAAPGKGRFTILIASAESRDPAVTTANLALDQIKAGASKGFEAMRKETADWWSNFWSRGMVYMHSDSGQADFVEENYTYYLYLMGSSSRGDYPPRFGGMLWFTDGDMSRWGSQYWWANTSSYYNNLMPANRMDLMDPLFKLYTGMLPGAAVAARQQWGTQGIWIPETDFFNGPETLPDDFAKEYQDLMLVRKPYEQRSPEFDHFIYTKNRHNSRWNWRNDGEWVHGYYIFKHKGTGIFGHTSHILSVAARIGNLAWQRYQFTGDQTWLRDRAYPFIKGAAEFYRHFPNLQKDEQGVYHINHTNNGESNWNSRDAPNEVNSMHTIFPLAVRASEILGVDADLRPVWQEIKDHLVQLPAGRGRRGGAAAYGSFTYGGADAIGTIAPIGPEPELKARFLGFNRLNSFIDEKGIGGAKIFRNRLRLREGPGAIDAEHLAGLAGGIHTTMLNSTPASLTNSEPITILSQWPKDWDAAFSLLARGGFIISSAQKAGAIPLVQIQSQLGGECRLANPWSGKDVTLYRNGRKAEDLSGAALAIPTAKGETVVVVPRGATPAVVKVL